MFNRYEQLPSIVEANFILFTMTDLNTIKSCLSNFRKATDNDSILKSFLTKFTNEKNNNLKPGISACSSTLVWSGTKGNNVPVDLFSGQIGFALDPSKVVMPHADFYASGTNSRIPEEINKKGAPLLNTKGSFSIETSKFEGKKGRVTDIYNSDHDVLVDMFLTNQAKWDRQETTYHQEGTPANFAKALWRRYFKKYNNDALMPTNEAIVLQKGKENPICGIIIIASAYLQLNDKVKNDIIAILNKNSNLKLYLYDPKLEEHIVREVDNEAAKLLLKQADLDIKSLPPFKGFVSRPIKKPSHNN